MNTRVACLQCNLCAHLFCSRNKKQFAHDTAQTVCKAISALLMEYLAFTQPALGLLFINIDTLFLINLQNKSALFCSVKLFHFPIICIGLIVTQMHPMIITCKIEMTPEPTASALLAQIGIVHLEF